MNWLRSLFHSADSTQQDQPLEEANSERSDFLAYLQIDNARLRGEVDRLRALNTSLELEAASKPRDTKPPEQMIPVGRKVYTTSQLKQMARGILVKEYKEMEQ
jgi:hypothetical protein